MSDTIEIGQIKSLELLDQLKRSNFSALVDIGNRNPLTRLKLGSKKILLPSSVEYLQEFFSKDQKSVVKTPKAQHYTAKAIGLGLVSTDQSAWIAKRNQAKGLFNREQLNGLIDNIQNSINKKLEQVPGKMILNDLLNSISINIIGQVFFGAFSNGDGETIKKAVNQMIEPTFKKIIAPVPFFIDPFSKLISKNRKVLFEILENNIAMARESTANNIIKQYYPTGNCTADIANIFVAGYETTYNTLFWLFYEINKNRSIKEKLSSELNAVTEFDSYQDLLDQIPFSIACVREVLRICPPIWIMSRTSLEKFSIGKIEVPSNADIILSPYLFHHLDKYWDKPNTFDPSRFLEANSSLENFPFYFPFGIGARACIGERLALMEIYLVMLNVFRRYFFTIESKEVLPQAHFTLRPSSVISITLNNQKNGK